MTTSVQSLVIALSMGAAACAPETEVDSEGPGRAGGDEPIGSVEQAYGEPQNGFPSWYERMIHVMVNRSRADPQADLAGCPNCADAACYTGPRNPVEWYYDHARSARFHARNLTSSACSIRHDSPCALVSNIASIYPTPCDGTVGCACQGGAATCGGSSNTPWNTRLSYFGVTGTIAENIATMGDAKAVFYQWLWEPTNSSACGWTTQNGHRYNILNNAYRRLGVGGAGNWTVQDFSAQGTVTQKILAGAHYPATGTNLEMRLNWASATPAATAYVNVGGTCSQLSLERGSATNGTYLGNVTVSAGCREYYFIVVDQNGTNTTYPTTGSFGVSCAADWSSNRPAEGPGCPNVPSCGNGVIDAGETCDPPASCPANCNDGNACTTDQTSGSAATCNVSCSHGNISACTNGDSCCPAGCNANTDTDCSASCGNGAVEAGETCDPPASCPASCSDGNACTSDSTTGSPATCNVSCGHTNISSCTNGDGCCPAGCTANTDNDCSASCGNGTIEPGETCDPPGTCPASCSDGNTCTLDATTGSAATCNVACGHSAITTCAAGDGCCPAGCDSTTDSDCSASCGNGVIEAGETCDPASTCPASCDDANACTLDGATGSAGNCNVACNHVVIVACAGGDGCCPAGCDPTNDGDCSTTCGDGTVDAGETCDPPDTCPATCDDNDACSVDTETGSAANCNAACSHNAIVSCDPGDGCCPAGCSEETDADCSMVCGNGTVDAGETCDPPDTCPSDCDDGDPCTDDLLTGSADTCTAQCQSTPVPDCGMGGGSAQGGGGGGDAGDQGEDSGCDCKAAPRSTQAPWALFALLALVGLRRRPVRSYD